ncbi:MAG: DUF4276 family protein [Candidatus Sumerlaeota bacterium]|nr:DUF4276 family protein [Candidatus Sumerlaeota bacterium]
MNEIRLAAIVEGRADAIALPLLTRRIAGVVDPALSIRVHPILRVPASRLLKEGELERRIEQAARNLEGRGGILILLDCDWKDGCPAIDGPRLLERARAERPDIPITVVLAKKEFEAWFIAAAASLRGKRELAEDLTPPSAPEEIRGAKEWLSARMPRTRPCAETIDQPALTAQFDMDAARRGADSFDKCYREIVQLLTTLQG